jgi:hypothetical protein
MAAFLSGCLTSDKAHPPHTAASAAAETAAETATAAAPQTAPQQTAARTGAAPTWTLDDLTQATPDAVKRLLGTPAFVRTEPPAAYWRYGDSTCALDLYFYAEGSGPVRVRHAELRRQSAADADGCLDHLRRTLIAAAADGG